MKFIYISALAILTLSSCGNTEGAEIINSEKQTTVKASKGLDVPDIIENNQDRVLAFYEVISTKKQKDLFNLISSNFKSHSLPGLGSVSDLKNYLISDSKDLTIKPLRSIQMGNTILTHSIYASKENKIVLDIATFVKGRITTIDHYSQPFSKSNISGNSIIYGPSEVVDVSKTGLHIGVIKKFMQAAVVGDSPNDIHTGINDNYVEHSPYLELGGNSLENRFVYSSNPKKENKIKYDTVVNIYGEGNFIITHCTGNINGTEKDIIDVFRMERNKISEHWDILSDK